MSRSIHDITDSEQMLILSILHRHLGELGYPLFEEGDVSVEVLRGYYDDAPKIIIEDGYRLQLIFKYDDPFFTVVYKIRRIDA